MNEKMLKAIMKEQGFTQEMLAERVGVDRSTLNRKIRGHHKGFSLQEACQVGYALQMTRGQMTEVFFANFDT